ncbi:MAG: hypothetical protein IPN44_02100 [Flavobacteriales bacterium]|nr:hypothetical protein [Flavobacteriales bacterium]
MKNILLAFTFLLLKSTVFAQTSVTTVINGDTIITFYNPADSLRKLGDLKGAIEYFKLMQKEEGRNFRRNYNYACALSVDEQIDSAFKYLALAQDISPNAFCDPDFLNLRKDKRWDEFEANLISLIQKRNGDPYKDVEYAKRLWHMRATDQAYYDCINLAEDKIGKNSSVSRALWKLKEGLDAENRQELVQLIETKGWPKNSVVGEDAAGAAFLVIQHWDTDQQKKYLPTIEKLCKENEASWESYALMYDRIQVSENKPQKYGSQIRFNSETNTYEPYPLLDETKVDEWRAEVGLGHLKDYVSNWGIVFPPETK